ncbi:MAG: Tim44/TimA family putative adaptor protein [Parvibaculaceae bacterium]|nr:Tim44/TimA family putative adaptor protein [Parvibaculaceae bacterium]
MGSEFDPLTLILLIIAVVVIFKLRSVLGQRTGHEQPPQDKSPYDRVKKEQADATDNAPNDNVIPLPGNSRSMPTREDVVNIGMSEDVPGLREIASADHSFDPGTFISGSRVAYEMIITAFASGNRGGLQGLLSQSVFESFDSVITGREARGETVEMEFVGLERSEITSAQLDGSKALITVEFDSSFTQSIKNEEGQVIDGDPITVRKVRDIWSFERDLQSQDPNWRVVATESGS